MVSVEVRRLALSGPHPRFHGSLGHFYFIGVETLCGSVRNHQGKFLRAADPTILQRFLFYEVTTFRHRLQPAPVRDAVGRAEISAPVRGESTAHIFQL